MSLNLIFRIIGMIVFGAGGAWLGVYLSELASGPPSLWVSVLTLSGILIGIVLTPYITIRPFNSIRNILKHVSVKTLFAGIIGLIIALIISLLASYPLSLLVSPLNRWLPVLSIIIFGYFGVWVFVSRQNEIFKLFRNLFRFDSGSPELSEDNRRHFQTLLDTSVIIDGRIADIARTGFLPGELNIPGFVLNELQYIADSTDNLRRQRGRRGLEVLAQMQKDPKIFVRISDLDVEGTHQADEKLILLARQLKVPIITNDFNLNKVAELQGIQILNINDLANAVKAVFLPGETLRVRVIQEGRENGQGVAYLEDGTMVVVQGGHKHIGEEMNTVVTKVLQTAAGRMIFSRME